MVLPGLKPGQQRRDQLLLHWNGTAWHAIALAAPILGIGAMTQDGHGGIRLAAEAVRRATRIPDNTR